MKLGATKHWREIMYLATGEKNLSAKGLLEYFAPLYIWLKDENKRLNLHIGWDDSISKIISLINFAMFINLNYKNFYCRMRKYVES